MKIYCINLKRSTERRAKMEQELAKTGLEYEFIEAVDGRKLTKDEIKKRYSIWRTRFRYGIGLTAGEIGCALSHKKFFEIVKNSQAKCAMVLEDDVALGIGFNTAVKEVEEFLAQQTKPTIVQLPGLKRDLPKNGDSKFIRVSSAMGTYAYAINRAGAELLERAYSPIKLPIDKYSYLIKHFGLQFYVYNKQVLSVDMVNASEVGKNRSHFLGWKMALYKIWRVIGCLTDVVLSKEEWAGRR